MALTVTNPVNLVDLYTGSVKQDGGDELLERFLGGMQTWFDSAVQRRVDMLEALDPLDMPEIQGSDGRTTLDYALWLVGLTDEWDWLVRQLSSAQKRALLRSAVALWKLKGLPYGWIRWISLLTAKPVLYRDYFHWRYLTDEDYLGDGPVLLDPIDDPVFGAYQFDLYVVDPGATLRGLVTQIVDVTRPSSQRVRLRWVDALETWDRDFSQWGERVGTVTLDTTARRATAQWSAVTPGRAVYTLLTLSFTTLVYRATFQGAAAGSQADFLFHYNDGANFAFVRFDYTAQTVAVWTCVAGVEALVAAAALPWPMPAAVDYHFELATTETPAGYEAVVRLDGDPVLTTAVAVGPVAGLFGFRASGTANLEVGDVMLFFPPLTYDYAAPDGAFDDEA